jgi:hypothetical protein
MDTGVNSYIFNSILPSAALDWLVLLSRQINSVFTRPPSAMKISVNHRRSRRRKPAQPFLPYDNNPV